MPRCATIDGVGAFRYVLYAAVVCSLSVYAYRAYRRWIAPHVGNAEAIPDDIDASASKAGAPTVAGTASESMTPPTVKRGLGFSDPNSLPSLQERAPSESLVQQVIREELARKQGQDPSAPPGSAGPAPSTGRSGLFAAGDGRADERVSVAAALTGARLPDELVPLVVGTQPDPHHVMFISPSGSAAAIGRHLGDELERLGYQMRSESDEVAVATKGSVNLRVTLHPDAGTERVDGAPRFPTASMSSVVVEFRT